MTTFAVAATLLLFGAACSLQGVDDNYFDGEGGGPAVASARGGAGGDVGAQTQPTAGAAGEVGESTGASSMERDVSMAGEGNVDPVGLAGAAGSLGAGGSSGVDDSVSAEGGGGDDMSTAAAEVRPDPDDCDVIPTGSPLVGWAAVAGRGVQTTTGGGALNPTLVTTLAELQEAAAGAEPRVVLVRGELEPGQIVIGSNKTIVGTCGAEVHGHLEVRASVNVIIRNLGIVGYGEGDCSLDPGFDPGVGCSSGADAVTVQSDSHHIWFDHCAVRDGTAGNLDVIDGADFMTVSWTKFSYTPRTDDAGSESTGAAGHRYSNLVGGTDAPAAFDDANALNVTWHHNWWADNVVERQPRVRFGQNHLFNNYYDSLTSNYCVRAGVQAGILLEGNFFNRVDDPHDFNTLEDQLTANITAGASNLYLATTSDRATGGAGAAFVTPPYAYTLDDADRVPLAVTMGAGPE